MTDDRKRNGTFEDLEVFKRAYRLSLKIHQASLNFPSIEQHALADQIRRSSKSMCANIAEGHARQGWSRPEFRRYVRLALSSADETRVWLRYCLDLGYVDEATWKVWRDECQEIARMLYALAKSVGEKDF